MSSRRGGLLCVGPRPPGPFEVLMFAAALALGVGDRCTSLHLSIFLDRVWPSGSTIYYSALGICGLVGLVSTSAWFLRRDSIRLTRVLLVGELFAVLWGSVMWSIWAGAGYALGWQGFHGAAVASALTGGGIWRAFQIWRDLDDIESAADTASSVVIEPTER